MPDNYDFAVVGAGIAGIAIAELLQRSGKKVLLLESENKLASVASAQQQSWFHMGALYAVFPSDNFFKSLVKNLECLLRYYSGFPHMNLGYGHHVSIAQLEGWFNNSRTYYFYVNPAEKEIALLKKPLWYLATLMARSRLAWFEKIDFMGDIDAQISKSTFSKYLNRAKSPRKFDLKFDKKSINLISYDRPLNSTIIINDLVKSFLCLGGELKLRSKVIKIEKNKLVVNEEMNITTYQARHIVLTTGQCIGELTPNIRGIKVVKSPLLVVVPALSDINFVRLSMNSSRIVNHFCHEVSDGDYSVIGDASYYDVDEDLDVDLLKSEMIDKVNKLFGCKVNAGDAVLFFGYKTELLGNKFSGKTEFRNYQYHLIDNDNCVLAFPGKFSLAFSLALSYCKHYGIDPPTRVPLLKGEQPYPVSEPLHGIIASKIYQNIKNA